MLATVIALTGIVQADSSTPDIANIYHLECDGPDPLSLQMKSNGMCETPWTLPEDRIIGGQPWVCEHKLCNVGDVCLSYEQGCTAVDTPALVESILALECAANPESVRDEDNDFVANCLEFLQGTHYDDADTDNDDIPDAYDLVPFPGADELEFLIDYLNIVDGYSGDDESSCDASRPTSDQHFDPYITGAKVTVLPYTEFAFKPEHLDGFKRGDHPWNVATIRGVMIANEVAPIEDNILDVTPLTGGLPQDIRSWFTGGISYSNPPTTSAKIYGLTDEDKGSGWGDVGEGDGDDPVGIEEVVGISIVQGWGEPMKRSTGGALGCTADLELAVLPVIGESEWVATATAGAAAQAGRVATLAEYDTNMQSFG